MAFFRPAAAGPQGSQSDRTISIKPKEIFRDKGFPFRNRRD